VVMGSGEGLPTPTDREPTFLKSGRYLGEPAFEHLETPLLLKSLVARAVTTEPSPPSPDGHGQAPSDPTDPRVEAPVLGNEVPHGELEGVLAFSSDRSGPTRGAGGCERALANTARGGTGFGVEPALPAPACKVASCQRSQVGADGQQHLRVGVGGVQPGPDPRTARRGHGEGLFDLTQPSGHGAIFRFGCDIRAAGPRSCSAQRRAFSARLRADRRP